MLSGEFCTFFENEALFLLGKTKECQIKLKAWHSYDPR